MKRSIDKFLSLPSSPYTTLRDDFATPWRTAFQASARSCFIIVASANDYLNISHGSIDVWRLLVKWTLYSGLWWAGSTLFFKWRLSRQS